MPRARIATSASEGPIVVLLLAEVTLVRLLEGRQEWLPPILEVSPRHLRARELVLTEFLCATPCPLLGSV